MINLRSILIIFNLLLLGGTSFYSASLASGMLRTALDGYMLPPIQKKENRPPAPSRQRMTLAMFSDVTDANVFKAKRSVIVNPKIIGPVSPTDAPPVVANPVELPVMLKGTVNLGNSAFAMVADKGGSNEKLYTVADCLPTREAVPERECAPEQGKLLRVFQDKIDVHYQGRVVSILLADDAPAAVRPKAVASQRRSPSMEKKNPRGNASNGSPFPITQDGNKLAVTVPSAEVEKAFENFGEVLKQARVVPYSGNGVEGFQIRNIRPGSIFQRIGLRNFDVIKSVNGENISTADQALGLLTAFRNESNINLEIQRRNEDLSIHYNIQ